jgi:ribosomal-protein-alanine N-acetyltransferase
MEFTVPTIETQRLILCPLTIDDAQSAFEWTGDERVAKYMIYSTHESIETTKEWLNSIKVSPEIYEWGFVRKSDNKLIGAGSIRYHSDEDKWEFGYNMRYDCWNMGYTTEATLAMMNYVREKHNAHLFKAQCASENIGSATVMEKCGLHFAGNGEYTSYDGKKTFVSKIYELEDEVND